MLAGTLDRALDVARYDGSAVESVELPPFAAVTDGALGEFDGVTCALDGAVFNLPELVDRLGLGRDTDAAELIARGFRKLGPEILTLLRGAYSIALWDRDARRGLLCHDHLAQRAIFFHTAGRRVIFGSEVRDVLRLLPERPGPDEVAVTHWIAEHQAYDDRTLFAGVSRLRQGEYLEIGETDCRRRVYWAPSYASPIDITREEAAAELRERLVRSLEARGAAAPGAGVILSGGLDSSTVAAVAKRGVGADPFPSYSAVFPDREGMDESARIAATTSYLDMPSTLVTIEPQGGLAASLEYLQRWDLPALSPAYWLERSVVETAADDGLRLAFDGQGGDELFGGSPYIPASHVQAGRLIEAWKSVARFPGMGDHPPIRKVAGALWAYGIRAAMPVRAQSIYRRFSRSPARDHFWLLPHAREVFHETDDSAQWKTLGGPLAWADRAARMGRERLRWGLPDYLRRRAADCGVEARSALIGDVDLVEFVLRLPLELTYTPWHNRALVREAMKGLLPEEVRLNRAKADFAPFTFETLAGPDFSAIERLLGSRDAEINAYTSHDAVRERFLINRPKPDTPESTWWTWRIWNLITAECWLRAQRDSSFVDDMLAGDLQRPRFEVLSRSHPRLAAGKC